MTAWSDRYACYQSALAVQRPGGGWTNGTLDQVARSYGVGLSTLRRWLAQGFPTRGQQTAFVPTHEDYVAVAVHLDIKAAWKSRRDKVQVSYETYRRAMVDRGDPALAQATLNGWDGVKNNRLYLMGRPLHRNHTWVMDHFEVPVPVVLPRYKHPVKPWGTLVGERCTDALLVLMLIIGKPTAETVAAAIAEAAVGRDYDGTWIGGLPVQVVYDNAKENEAEPIANGLARFGVLGAPTDTYGSWQNPAESMVGRTKHEACAGLPGVTMGGTARDGQPRFGPARRDDIMGIEELARHFDDFRQDWNTRRPSSTREGRTPVESWNADDTEIREVGEAQLVANMTKQAKPHLVLPKGVNFRGDYYLPLPQAGDDTGWRGREVHVRYLERNKDFIVVSRDPHFNDFRFAINQRATTPEHRVKLLQQVAKVEQQARLVDLDATRRRTHQKASEGRGYGTDDRAADDDTCGPGAGHDDTDRPGAGHDDTDRPGAGHDDTDGPGAGRDDHNPGRDDTDIDGRSGTRALMGNTATYDDDLGVTVTDTSQTSRRARQASRTPVPIAPARGEGPLARKQRDKRAREAAAAAAARDLPLPPSRRTDPGATGTSTGRPQDTP